VPLSLALNRLASFSPVLSLMTLAAFVFAAVWLAHAGEEIFREKDSRRIVVDEIAGFLLANFLSPLALAPTVAAFILFRFFDIIKLYPADKAERIAGGFGVVADDLVAGLYTFLILRLLSYGGML
jgi:phosphatidylglycerophosphatase A